MHSETEARQGCRSRQRHVRLPHPKEGQTPRPLKVLSVASHFLRLGGAEAVIRRHYENDATFGLNAMFVSLRESEPRGWPRAKFLGLDESFSVAASIRRFRKAVEGFNPAVAVYHTLWGTSCFAPYDSAARRVLYLHTDFPGLDWYLTDCRDWIDGYVCVSKTLISRVQAHLPESRHNDILRVNYPILPNAGIGLKQQEREFKIGFAGRLSRRQKRIDRFVELARHLARDKIAHRIEFIGDGVDRDWLEHKLPDRERYVFHGKLDGVRYWQTLSALDAVVFVSDFEGTPIAQLEALSVGVPTFFPAIGCGGDEYALSIDPNFLYPPGNMISLAQSIMRFAAEREEARNTIRQRCIAATAAHSPEPYGAAFAGFLQKLASSQKRTLAAPPPNVFRRSLSFRGLRWLNLFHGNRSSLWRLFARYKETRC